MKLLIIALGFASIAASAATYSLEDRAIIGKYGLKTPDNNALVQSAQFYYDSTSQLSLYVDGIEMDLNLQRPNAVGLINKQEFEPVDCDHDDTKCGQVENTEVYLLRGKDSQGRDVPELKINVRQSYFSGKRSRSGEAIYRESRSTYSLVWREALPHGGMPVVTYDKKVPEMAALLDECHAMARGFSDYPTDQIFCPQVLIYDVKFSMEEGVAAVLGRAIDIGQTKRTNFDRARNEFFGLPLSNIDRAMSQKADRSKAEGLRANIQRLSEFLLQKSSEGAEFYDHHANYGNTLYVVDGKTKSIFRIQYYKVRD